MSEHDVLFIDDLARELRTSRRTIERRRQDGGRKLPPEASSPDNRPRWHRATVEEWKARTKTAAQWRMVPRAAR